MSALLVFKNPIVRCELLTNLISLFVSFFIGSLMLGNFTTAIIVSASDSILCWVIMIALQGIGRGFI